METPGKRTAANTIGGQSDPLGIVNQANDGRRGSNAARRTNCHVRTSAKHASLWSRERLPADSTDKICRAHGSNHIRSATKASDGATIIKSLGALGSARFRSRFWQPSFPQGSPGGHVQAEPSSRIGQGINPAV
jgi:hypothetical protein